MRLKHIDDFATRRSLLLHEVDVVVDIGANVGHYARALRQRGFPGRIVSIEPVPEAFARLQEVSAHDPNWVCVDVALSDRSGIAALNVSRNVVSSSLMALTEEETRGAPETGMARTIEVKVTTLDAMKGDQFAGGERLFLKLDVQGHEAQVLVGAQHTLEQVVAVEAELTILPLYEEQGLISEIAEWLHERGFDLVTIEPEYRDLRSGELKQLNGIFAARSSPIRRGY